MTVLDANILLYAYNADAPQHRAAAAWLEELLEGSGIIGLSWATLWAFLRISTNGRVWPNPMSPRDAFAVVRRLLMQPDVVVLHPGPRHLELLETLVTETGAIGPLVSDAALAALAIEHGAQLASTDHDFSRFPTLRWLNPVPSAL
jgi:hypothetical protein